MTIKSFASNVDFSFDKKVLHGARLTPVCKTLGVFS